MLHKQKARKIHPGLFLLLLAVIFLAPAAVNAFSGVSVPKPQLPDTTFPVFRR